MHNLLKASLVGLLLVSSIASAGGLIGDLVETVCGNCGAGEALDDAHDDVKDALPGYGAAEEAVTHGFKELTVETAGPALAQWIRASRNDAVRAGTAPMPNHIRIALRGFFSERLLDRVTYRVGRGKG